MCTCCFKLVLKKSNKLSGWPSWDHKTYCGESSCVGNNGGIKYELSEMFIMFSNKIDDNGEEVRGDFQICTETMDLYRSKLFPCPFGIQDVKRIDNQYKEGYSLQLKYIK